MNIVVLEDVDHMLNNHRLDLGIHMGSIPEHTHTPVCRYHIEVCGTALRGHLAMTDWRCSGRCLGPMEATAVLHKSQKACWKIQKATSHFLGLGSWVLVLVV